MKRSPGVRVIAAAVVWGSSGVFVKLLGLPPTTLTFFRLAVPTAAIAGYFLTGCSLPGRRRPGRLSLPKLNAAVITASCLNAIRMFLYITAFTMTGVGNAVVMLYTWPVWATLLGVLFLKERLRPLNILLLGTAVIGIGVVYMRSDFTFADRDFIGMSAMLLSAFIYALTVVIFKKELSRYTGLEVTFFQNMVGTLVFFPFLLLNRPLPAPGQAGFAVIYAGLIGLFGYILFFSALKRMDASRASHLSYIEVLSGICFGALVLSERVTWNIVAGGALIVVSLLFLKREDA